VEGEKAMWVRWTRFAERFMCGVIFPLIEIMQQQCRKQSSSASIIFKTLLDFQLQFDGQAPCFGRPDQ
jgi:hypothetical protein